MSETEKAFSSNPFKSKKTFKRIKNVVRNAPVTGTVIDIADIGKSLLTGNYSQAAIDAGLALAGVTPVGKVASKGILKTLKLFSKNKKDEPMGLVNNQIEKAPFDRGEIYGGNVREPHVKTVVVPIEQAEKLFPNRQRTAEPEYLDALKTEILKGKKLAPPFLNVEVPKKGSALLTIGHEGAHRIAVLNSLGHKYVPIDILSNVKLRDKKGDKIYKDILEGNRLAGQEGYMYTKRTGEEFNKGGTIMNKQMNMAFMQEGGEVERDPVSGNEVPTGSFPKEVRDDVPAMLSEGEYVVPADVLRFYGLKFFEDLRAEAKIALATMEQKGRIGGEPVGEDTTTAAVNKGGVIHAAPGVMVSSMTPEQQAAKEAAEAQAATPTYTAPIKTPTNAAFQTAVSAPKTFGSGVGSGFGNTVLFINAKGLTMQILVNDKGLPLYGAPPGYVNSNSEQGKKFMVAAGLAPDTGDSTAPEVAEPEIKPVKAKKDKTAAERKAKADATATRNANALKTSAGRIFGLENENDPLSVSAANLKTYENLSFTERVKLIPKEFDKDVLSDSDKAEIEAMANNKSDGSALSTLALTLFPWLGFFGVGKDKTPTTPDTAPKINNTEQSKVDSGFSKAKKDDDGGYTIKTKDDKDHKVTSEQANIITDMASQIDEDDADNFEDFNKGALVTKPKRKPRVKRKSLGQK